MTVAAAALAFVAATQVQTDGFRKYDHPVMTWVPPYAVAEATTQLMANPAKGKWMKDALTHVGLQWWQPTNSGGVGMLTDPGVTDAGVIAIRDWAHANGIRAMLCVFNAGGGNWDWPLAKSAFADHRKQFVTALVNEVARLNLDGVDVDLEGDGEFESDRAAYVAFVSDLSTKLHAKKKHLTADSFAYVWNAPNQNWWSDLLPMVDGLTTMGYEQTGATASEWRAYSFQKAAAGANASKLMIGFPSNLNRWQGSTLADQLNWVLQDGAVGMSFWDAQIPGSSWKDASTWKTISQIRTG